jgi:hypothetical protein
VSEARAVTSWGGEGYKSLLLMGQGREGISLGGGHLKCGVTCSGPTVCDGWVWGLDHEIGRIFQP